MREREELASVAAFGAEEHDYAMRRELELLCREKVQWEREQRLL